MTLDYLRFAVASVVVKEHTDNNFENVAKLFYMIFRQMKILELIKIIDALTINEETDRALKTQMLHYIEFIVVNLSQKILSFQRVGETPETAFNNYLESENISHEQLQEKITTLIYKEHKEVKEVAVTVNNLVLLAL